MIVSFGQVRLIRPVGHRLSVNGEKEHTADWELVPSPRERRES
jgi:hypothetical protein